MNNCLACFEKEETIKRLERENTIFKNKFRKVDVDGWKGRDKLIIEKIGADWILKEHRKDKESGEIAKSSHIIPEINVADVWTIIKDRVELHERTTSRKVALDIISKRRIGVSIDEFWGGKCRAQFYFPLLYYPLKVLESKGFIKYGGRGNIVRLKE